MKFKDYYAALGVDRSVSQEDIQKAYRKLARQYHPDINKAPDAEARFKEIGEANDTLSNPEKRAAYDRLGEQPAGQDFRPPPDWQQQYGEADHVFEDIDLGDLFRAFQGGRQGRSQGGTAVSFPGEDFEITVPISMDDAYHGTTVNLDLSVAERDARGVLRRVPRAFTARIPRGATDGDRLRIPSKGGPGINGGPPGDLYINVILRPHALFRVSNHDVYLDLPLAPWEAALGTTVEVPTPAGAVQLKVSPGTKAGQQLRLGKKGLPTPRGEPGDLFAVVQIVVPETLTEQERNLLKQLAEKSTFNPRAYFAQEVRNESRTH